MSLLTGSAPATQEDLETLINEGAEENIHLEFKASGALKKNEGSKKNWQKIFLPLLIQMVVPSFME